MRLLVWNVQGFTGGLGRCAELIRSLSPGAACLNEVRRRTERRLARATGMTVVRGASPFGPRYRNALLLPAPPAWWRRVAFTPTPGLARRGAVIASTGSGLVLCAVHLGLDAAERERHARELMNALSGLEAVVVGGDLNERSAGPAGAVLAVRFVAAGAGPTFPSHEPVAPIDHVLVTRGARVLSCAVVDSVLSDHRPLLAEVEREEG